MKGNVIDIERETERNHNFRKVLFTGKHEQLVVMSLKPGEDIGEEVHNVDQFFRIEHGSGVVELDGKPSRIHENSAFVVPAGTKHNVINRSNDELQLYTVYSEPQHADGVVHKTKAEAMAEEHEGQPQPWVRDEWP